MVPAFPASNVSLLLVNVEPQPSNGRRWDQIVRSHRHDRHLILVTWVLKVRSIERKNKRNKCSWGISRNIFLIQETKVLKSAAESLIRKGPFPRARNTLFSGQKWFLRQFFRLIWGIFGLWQWSQIFSESVRSPKSQNMTWWQQDGSRCPDVIYE